MAETTGRVSGEGPRRPSADPAEQRSTVKDGQAFTKAFTYFIRVDVSSRHFSEEHPHRFLEFVKAEVLILCQDIARSTPSTSVTLWPGLFVFSENESKESLKLEQDRGTFLIGIRPSNSTSDVGDAQDELFKTTQRFEQHLRSQPAFVDEDVPPNISARFVKGARLGRLVVDEWIWPQSGAPLMFSVSSEEPQQSYDFLADVDVNREPDSEPKGGSSKLRPATEVLSRLRWDQELDSSDYNVVYLDRFSGYKEIPVNQWKSETTEDEFIPQHRITAFKQRSTGEIVWHRAEKIDKIFRR